MTVKNRLRKKPFHTAEKRQIIYRNADLFWHKIFCETCCRHQCPKWSICRDHREQSQNPAFSYATAGFCLSKCCWWICMSWTPVALVTVCRTPRLNAEVSESETSRSLQAIQKCLLLWIRQYLWWVGGRWAGGSAPRARVLSGRSKQRAALGCKRARL